MHRMGLAVVALVFAASNPLLPAASHSQSASEQRIAGFPINLPSLPSGGSGSSTQPQQPTPANSSFKGFSGQTTVYSDNYNGFKLKIPVEFTLHDKGATTDWIGPQVDGGVAMIYINAAPLKGVPSQVVYNANFKSKQEDRNYTEVVPVKVKFGNKTVPAFRCKEANHKPGSPDSKAPDDIHRWHLFVFGNEMVYTLGFTGPFSAFQANKLQSAFEPVIQSVELIAITQ